jgi:hypothetical protein
MVEHSQFDVGPAFIASRFPELSLVEPTENKEDCTGVLRNVTLSHQLLEGTKEFSIGYEVQFILPDYTHTRVIMILHTND